MGKDIYPLKFEPIYRKQAWGGSLLAERFDRGLVSNDQVSECLDLVDDGETQSVITNGPLAGKTLREAVATYPRSLVSNRHHADQPFPLCSKYLVTGRQLPVMVHPDDQHSADLPGVPANTKLWFVIAAQPKAEITAGIKPRFTQQQFLTYLHSQDLETIVHTFPAEPGDAYFLSAGRVHSLSAGNLILSIEQTATPPLVVSNWGRDEPEWPIQSDQTEHALKAIHFQDRMIARIRGDGSTAPRNRKLPLVTNCPHFNVDELRLIRSLHERTDGSGFHWIVALDGSVEVVAGSVTTQLTCGEGCLIPASTGYYELTPQGGLTKVLKVAHRA